jgi:hypothetical protein
VDSELFTLTGQTCFEFSRIFPGARNIRNDDHRKLTLDDSLIDVDDAAVGFSQNLRNSSHNSRMVHAKNRNDHSVGGTFRLRSD